MPNVLLGTASLLHLDDYCTQTDRGVYTNALVVLGYQ